MGILKPRGEKKWQKNIAKTNILDVIMQYHIIWMTKYCYKVLKGEVAVRQRELVRYGCEARGMVIVQRSVVSDDIIHFLLSCSPSMASCKIVQCLKSRSSRLLQEQFSDSKKKYWGRNLWGRGYFCVTVGSITEETIRQYIESQFTQENDRFKIED